MRTFGWRSFGWGLTVLAWVVSCSAPATLTPSPMPPTPAILTDTPVPTVAPTSTAVPTPAPTDTPTLAPSATLTPAPTETPLPTDTPTLAATFTATLEPSVTITQNTYLRGGPGLVYGVVGSAKTGQTLKVVGRDATAKWLVVVLPTDAKRRGWVSLAVARFNGEPAGLSEVAAPPTPTATFTFTPTYTPSPAPTATATKPRSSHNIVGELRLCNPTKPSFATAIERICFYMLIRNLGAETVQYGALGVHAVSLTGPHHQFQPSWTAITNMLSVCGGCAGPTGTGWEDGMFIQQPGTYNLTLDICYLDLSACSAGNGWETLTAPIQVTVVDWTPSP